MSGPWSPEREAEIRDWLAELGSRKDSAAVGPYAALRDTLAELDRVRAERDAAVQAREAAYAAYEHVCRTIERGSALYPSGGAAR